MTKDKIIANQKEAYDNLEAVSRAQVGTISDRRAALLHLAQRTHPHSDGCSGCLAIERELEIARKSK